MKTRYIHSCDPLGATHPQRMPDGCTHLEVRWECPECGQWWTAIWRGRDSGLAGEGLAGEGRRFRRWWQVRWPDRRWKP